MPQLIEHIDAIARRKQRDVLFIIFTEEFDGAPVSCNWRENRSRALIIEWLDVNEYAWSKCAEYANVNRMSSYAGSIYVDTPFDKDDPKYQALETFLEHPDASMRFPEMTFCALSLQSALKNAHHDEPGFWESWADNF